MRGISEERLIDIFACYPLEAAEKIILQECQELQEPWMPIDEFLKSGFRGVCFVFTEPYTILCERTNCGFFGTGGIMFDISSITHVIPIHNPEPPR